MQAYISTVDTTSVKTPLNDEYSPVVYSQGHLYELLVGNPDGVFIEAICRPGIMVKVIATEVSESDEEEQDV
jgi:hypothetical protein